MKWQTGEYTSIPKDGRAFIERERPGQWWIYKTGHDGRLLAGFPKLHDAPFPSVEFAQAWVEKNVDPRVIDCEQCGDSGIILDPDSNVAGHRCICAAGQQFRPPIGDA